MLAVWPTSTVGILPAIQCIAENFSLSASARAGKPTDYSRGDAHDTCLFLVILQYYISRAFYLLNAAEVWLRIYGLSKKSGR